MSIPGLRWVRWNLRLASQPAKPPGGSFSVPPRPLQTAGRGDFQTLSLPWRAVGCAFAPGRAQRGAELPLVISDHADWWELQETILGTEAAEIWVTHGQEDALVHWCQSQGLAARPLRLVGYGDEEAA